MTPAKPFQWAIAHLQHDHQSSPIHDDTSPQRPHILLTNDDGIEAEGLRVMAAALAPLADLTIVAPRHEQSGMAHAVSVFKDMHLEAIQHDGQPWGWALVGTPADCVKVAIADLQHERPIDLVVSGINRGQNAGIHVIYSGTVAAAREAAMLGLPAMAISLLYHEEDDLPFETAGRVGREVVQMIFQHGLPRGILLNVNVPPVPYEALRGWRSTRMGNSGYIDYYDRGDPAANTFGLRVNVGKGWIPSTPRADDADDHALMEGYVSITPLHADLTAHTFVETLGGWLAEKNR